MILADLRPEELVDLGPSRGTKIALLVPSQPSRLPRVSVVARPGRIGPRAQSLAPDGSNALQARQHLRSRLPRDPALLHQVRAAYLVSTHLSSGGGRMLRSLPSTKDAHS